MKISILLLSSLSLLLLTCNTTKNKPVDKEVKDTVVEDTIVWNPQLHDIWILTELNEKALDGIRNRPRLELFPADNRMSGHGGCNDLFGNIKAAASHISFSQVGSTKMYCADEMALENEFLKTLSEVNRYQIKGLKLYFFAAKEMVMVFQKVD